ncbi:HNH endonuclease [Corynebacterium bovis]|uniref:HNH endonuclease signature motif containing protein n=1 Tax=Corynebacterium bovis TaxID=36808 RepID=UPI00313888EB
MSQQIRRTRTERTEQTVAPVDTPTTTTQRFAEGVELVATGLRMLADLGDLSVADAPALLSHIIRLEHVVTAKAVVDLRTTDLVVRARAADRQGSSKPVDFLVESLGLSVREANERLRARDLLMKPVDPQPVPLPEDAPDEDLQAAREAALEQARQENALRERNTATTVLANRRVLDGTSRAVPVGIATLAGAAAETCRLVRGARLSTQDVVSRMLTRATAPVPPGSTAPGATGNRRTARGLVDGANREAPRDLIEATRKRTCSVSRTGSDGMQRLTLSLPEHLMAVVTAFLATAGAPGSGMAPGPAAGGASAGTTSPADGTGTRGPGNNGGDHGCNHGHNRDRDLRNRGQRWADAIVRACRAGAADTTESRPVASLLVSTTRRELAEAVTAPTRPLLLTSTGHTLSWAELVSVGLTTQWLEAIHDGNGRVVELRTNGRLATAWQRAALFAYQGCCAHPGCEEPASRTQAHHVRAWIAGGRTDVENLLLLCPRHHVDNDDSRSRATRGYADISPDGEPVWIPPAGHDPGRRPRSNTSPTALAAAGARIRAGEATEPVGGGAR